MITIKIETENDAFKKEKWTAEVSRILSDLAIRIGVKGSESGSIYDINGNKVGSFRCS